MRKVLLLKALLIYGVYRVQLTKFKYPLQHSLYVMVKNGNLI